MQNAKLDELLAKEKTKHQEKSVDLQRVEGDARRFKEEWEKESKEKVELEAQLRTEIQTREYLSFLYFNIYVIIW